MCLIWSKFVHQLFLCFTTIYCACFSAGPAEAVEIGLAAEIGLLINLGLWSQALAQTSGASWSDWSWFDLLQSPTTLQLRSVASTHPSSLLQHFAQGDKWVNRLQGQGLGHVPEPQQVNEQLPRRKRFSRDTSSCYLSLTWLCLCLLSQNVLVQWFPSRQSGRPKDCVGGAQWQEVQTEGRLISLQPALHELSAGPRCYGAPLRSPPPSAPPWGGRGCGRRRQLWRPLRVAGGPLRQKGRGSRGRGGAEIGRPGLWGRGAERKERGM